MISFFCKWSCSSCRELPVIIHVTELGLVHVLYGVHSSLRVWFAETKEVPYKVSETILGM